MTTDTTALPPPMPRPQPRPLPMSVEAYASPVLVSALLYLAERKALRLAMQEHARRNYVDLRPNGVEAERRERLSWTGLEVDMFACQRCDEWHALSEVVETADGWRLCEGCAEESER